MTYRVGLTGGIGSGKSTVAKLFAGLGVPVIDTDVISHQLTQAGGAAIPSIRVTFGSDYIDTSGALDRPKMRQLVFSDNCARQKLQEILHPLIFEQVKTQANAQPAPYIMVVIPLLFETNHYQPWLHRIATVDCSEEKQLERVLQRSGLDEQTARSIMSHQLSRAKRKQLADDIIDNDGSLDDLSRQISILNRIYLELAQSSN